MRRCKPAGTGIAFNFARMAWFVADCRSNHAANSGSRWICSSASAIRVSLGSATSARYNARTRLACWLSIALLLSAVCRICHIHDQLLELGHAARDARLDGAERHVE